MTLRPFKITYNTSKQHGLRHSIMNHRGEYISKERKLGNKFFDKLLSYPITAFGYDIFQVNSTTWAKALGDPTFNPKFDKKDVIKALDFWIEYFVYQNKCDYILENTVNKDFELHLEELVRVREAVLKDPADTKYVRQKIRPKTIMGVYPGHDGGKDFGTYTTFITNKDGLIEFTENVLDTSNYNLPFSTVDQFCYKVKTMTRKEYENSKPYATGTIGYRWGLIDNFRDDLQRFNFTSPGITTAGWFQAAVDNSMSELSRALSEVGAGTTITPGGDWNAISDTEEVPITAQSITVTDDESDIITYENMNIVNISNDIFPSNSDDFIMIPITFSGNGTEISMDTFVNSSNSIERLINSWSAHRIQIRPNQQNFLEIDGQEYHTTNVSIRHNPMRPSIRFDDLWIESVEVSVDGRGSTFRVDFIQIPQQNLNMVRTGLSIILVNPSQGSLMRQSINNDQQRAWSLQMLGNNRVWIGDARANEGRGEGDVYDIIEPVRIDILLTTTS
jgi:hypothetical protein